MPHQVLIENLFNGQNVSIQSLSGGDINAVYVVEGQEKYAIKINTVNNYPEMLKKEAKGLSILEIPKGCEIPTVLQVGEDEDFQYLVLSYIEEGAKTERFWENFGMRLAHQHQVNQSAFGLAEDNYIGSLVQSNTRHSNWVEFLITERFLPLLKLAQDSSIINKDERKNIEAIFPFCQELWPIEKPSLLHGDLWSGNFISGKDELPYLIDPAVYYGHREMDIGMMRLFGGFDPLLFEVYSNVHPLEKGWKSRVQYNQIYPLLVHLNLFGRSYLDQINSIVTSFS